VTPPAALPRAPLSPRLVAALAALVVLVGAISSITPDPIGVFWDDGVYLLTAKALASGGGYRYLYLPGAPPAIHYPPGFPLLLAALLKVTPEFPANVAVLKFVNPICLALGVYGTVRLGVRTMGLADVPAAIAVGICALAAPVLVLSNALLSESLFFAMLVGALLLVDAVVARGGTRSAVGAAAGIAALSLVRTVGGALLPAAVIALWWRGRRREAAVVFVGTLVLLAPYQWWVWSAARGFPDELRGSYGPYLEWVVAGYRRDPALAWQVVTRNAGELWRAFGIVFAVRLPHAVKLLAATTLCATCVAGLAVLARRASAFVLFLLAYGAVVLLWPYNPERFVWALWPLLGLVLLAAARGAGEWGARRWRQAPRAAAAVVALLLTGHAAYTVRGVAAGWAGASQRGMTDRVWPLVQWTVVHAGTNDVVASDAHVIIALYTGRTTIPVSMLTPAEYVRPKPVAQLAHELDSLAKRYRPSLLVLSRNTPELDAVPQWALLAGAPMVNALPEVPGGGSAFALRWRDD